MMSDSEGLDVYRGQHTCDNLWSLKVLIWVDVAGRQSQVEAQNNQKEVDSSPHSWRPTKFSPKADYKTGTASLAIREPDVSWAHF